MPVNVPPWSYWHVYPVADFVGRLHKAEANLPITVTSWFRDPDHNRSEGGDEHSQHLVGLARGYTGPMWALKVLAQRARELGVVPVFESDHLHIQAFPAGLLRV